MTTTEIYEPPNSDNPLVSVCFLSYNQEKYIRDAINSVLAQTYSPLEIIISDDCSTDKTFDIIKECVAAYNGPHKIVLDRAEKNGGVIENTNRCFSQASGELFVFASDDDISYPNRVEVIVENWLKFNKEPLLITSSYRKIDCWGKVLSIHNNQTTQIDNREVGEIFGSANIYYIGAMNAYSRKLFDTFGVMKYHNAFEDTVYIGRTLLLGSFLSISDCLMDYRTGSGVSSKQSDYRRSMAGMIHKSRFGLLQSIDDLSTIKDQEPARMSHAEWQKWLEAHLQQVNTALKLWTGKTFAQRCSGISNFKKLSLQQKFIVVCLLFSGYGGDFFLQLPFTIRNTFRRIRSL